MKTPTIVLVPEGQRNQPDLIPVVNDDSAAGSYFLSLAIAGIRTFSSEQRLDLSDGKGGVARWTILLGDNGVGKTTLLRCLALTEPRVPYDLPEALRFYDVVQVNAHRRSKQLPGYIKVDLGLASNFASPVLEHGSIEVTFRDKGDGIGTFGQVRNKVDIYGYGALRRVGSVTLSEGVKTHPSATLFDDNIPLLNAEEWLLQADYAATKSNDAVAARRFTQIKSILLGLLPDADDIRVAAQGPKTPVVEVRMPYGWVEMRSLSSGYRSVIAWMVDLANRLFSRYPDSENPLSQPAIVLVDQIDMFLHPKWQRELLRNLSQIFPKAQFIVTAHSPLVVQGVPDANIALLRREGDHVVIDQTVKSVRGWRLDQVLASDLFDNVQSRDPETEKLLAERKDLLTKPHLTDAEQNRADELERLLEALPIGESEEEMRAMAILQRAAKRLESAQ